MRVNPQVLFIHSDEGVAFGVGDHASAYALLMMLLVVCPTGSPASAIRLRGACTARCGVRGPGAATGPTHIALAFRHADV